MTVHCEWGPNGIAELAGRVRAFVIVDVLSFSTCVDVATGREAQIVPFPLGDHAAAMRRAEEIGALVATHRTEAGPYSLSPATLANIPAGTRLVLPSPNGSKLSLTAAATGAAVFAGCLRNAGAVAQAVRGFGDIAVIPAGERWTSDDSLRPAIEDLIGVGAILEALDMRLSVEARVARDAFRAARSDLASIIRQSMSGQELIERGFPQDVEMAVAYGVSANAPRLVDGVYGATTSML